MLLHVWRASWASILAFVLAQPRKRIVHIYSEVTGVDELGDTKMAINKVSYGWGLLVQPVGRVSKSE